MENSPIFIIVFLVVATLVAIPLSKLISRGLLTSWRELAVAYPGKELELGIKKRFTSAMIVSSGLPLRFNNMLQLSASYEYLGLSTNFFSHPEVLITRSDIKCFNDKSAWLFTKVEICFHKSDLSVVFWGRGGRFVKEWWEQELAVHRSR
ncbi:hypothetical protein [Geomonas propionica]|uniref:GRAM domain-containing protein n=1 Tax=Geomonas propionica TaxID=2798582 RepID=A0ABS0YMC4_9BACT|nr:hypothetical protein [Geomonas propionica]MBJ6799030.1 hypothetical protein [Geomonas propionica]